MLKAICTSEELESLDLLLGESIREMSDDMVIPEEHKSNVMRYLMAVHITAIKKAALIVSGESVDLVDWRRINSNI